MAVHSNAQSKHVPSPHPVQLLLLFFFLFISTAAANVSCNCGYVASAHIVRRLRRQRDIATAAAPHRRVCWMCLKCCRSSSNYNSADCALLCCAFRWTLVVSPIPSCLVHCQPIPPSQRNTSRPSSSSSLLQFFYYSFLRTSELRTRTARQIDRQTLTTNSSLSLSLSLFRLGLLCAHNSLNRARVFSHTKQNRAHLLIHSRGLRHWLLSLHFNIKYS